MDERAIKGVLEGQLVAFVNDVCSFNWEQYRALYSRWRNFYKKPNSKTMLGTLRSPRRTFRMLFRPSDLYLYYKYCRNSGCFKTTRRALSIVSLWMIKRKIGKRP